MSQISTNFWTYSTSSSATTINITSLDSINSLSILVSGGGSNSATVTGSRTIDGNASSALAVADGETLTIAAPFGRALDNITVVTSSDMVTKLIASI
tara:strand:- start:415 stop:705 length:291 start_codon:yes stop_codon:yes gene_type:complete